jgi:hypothetical protein
VLTGASRPFTKNADLLEAALYHWLKWPAQAQVNHAHYHIMALREIQGFHFKRTKFLPKLSG